jgi:hypothetical protein
MPVCRLAQVPSANSVPYAVTVRLASIMVQPLVMVARASSGAQSARTIYTNAGEQETNLCLYPTTTGDGKR